VQPSRRDFFSFRRKCASACARLALGRAEEAALGGKATHLGEEEGGMEEKELLISRK